MKGFSDDWSFAVMPAYPKPVKKPKVKKRKKKTERQKMEIELDHLVREIVFVRDNGCVTPAPENGHSAIRQPGHLFKRTFESIKWDLYNVHEQCSSCNGRHVYYTNYYRWWFKDKFGDEEYNRLDHDARVTVKMSLDDLEILFIELTEIQKQQESEPNWKPYFSQEDIFSGAWRK